MSPSPGKGLDDITRFDPTPIPFPRIPSSSPSKVKPFYDGKVLASGMILREGGRKRRGLLVDDFWDTFGVIDRSWRIREFAVLYFKLCERARSRKRIFGWII